MNKNLSPKQFLSWLEGCLETSQSDNVIIPIEVLESRLQQFKAWIDESDMKSELREICFDTIQKLLKPYVKR